MVKTKILVNDLYPVARVYVNIFKAGWISKFNFSPIKVFHIDLVKALHIIGQNPGDRGDL